MLEVETKYVHFVEGNDFQIEPVFGSENYCSLVFAFDDKYSKYFAITLQSLIENSSIDFLYDIVVFTSDLSDKNAKRLLRFIPSNFSLRFFNIKKYIASSFKNIELSAKSYWSEEMYYRIFIPIIMNKYKKVLYIDSDTIFNGDIQDLFSIDFENKEVIAVSDTIKLVLKNKTLEERLEYIKKDLGIKDPKQYFNSGVLLFNVAEIDLDNYIRRFLNAMNLEKLYYPDQDLLNVMFRDRSKLVDWKWNLQYHIPIYHQKDIIDMEKRDYEEYFKAFENPIIVHYTSILKPWINPTLELSDLFWFYARKNLYYEEILFSMNEKTVIDSAKSMDLYIKLQNGKRIVLWGASLFLEQFITQYDIKTNNIVGIIDKNPARQGTSIKQYKCYAPNCIKNLKPDEIIITILHYADEREKEIRSFIKSNNLKNIKITRLV